MPRLDDDDEDNGDLESLEWKADRITLSQTRPDGSKNLSRTIEAIRYGFIAIHNDILSPTVWAVTSVTTGVRITKVSTQEDAAKIAMELQNVAGEVFKLKSQQEIIKSLPTWIKPWVKECEATLRFVKPATFRKQ